MRSILIAVTGESPAVLTETLWALGTRRDDSVIPDVVVAITTSRGEDTLRRSLLAPDDAWGGKTVWATLADDLAAATGRDLRGRLTLDIRVLTAPPTSAGEPVRLADLTTEEESRAAADFILREVRSWCEPDDTTVIASIAGGRKSMGAFLYAAMTLVGRSKDRVTHVMVDPAHEVRGFYYPAQPVQPLDGRAAPGTKPPVVKAADAVLSLATLPFVPLRNRFDDLAGQPSTFSGMVQRFSEQLGQRAPARIRFRHGDDPAIQIDGEWISLPATTVAVVRALLEMTDAGILLPDQPTSATMAALWWGLAPAGDRKDEVNRLDPVLKKAVESRLQSQPKPPEGVDPAQLRQADEATIRRCLSDLRTRAARRGLLWTPEKRKLRFPPFQLVK